MEVKIPLRVPPPPCRGDRDEDPTDVPRPDVDVQSDLGAVAFRAESVRVPDVRARIPCGNGIAVRRIEGHVLIDRHRGGSCGWVPQPDFIPAPPEDETCASSRRVRVLVVVLSEVSPPGEHRVAREGDHAIQGESHRLQATAAMSHEPRELTLFKVDLWMANRLDDAGRYGGGGGGAGAAYVRARFRRRIAEVCTNAPSANTPRPARAAVIGATPSRNRPRASRSPPIAAGMISMDSSVRYDEMSNTKTNSRDTV